MNDVDTRLWAKMTEGNEELIVHLSVSKDRCCVGGQDFVVKLVSFLVFDKVLFPQKAVATCRANIVFGQKLMNTFHMSFQPIFTRKYFVALKREPEINVLG